MMAAQGATVVVAGRRQAPLDEAVAAIAAAGGPPASTFTADLADPDSAAQLAHDVLARHGRCDIVVNNAGFSSKVRNPRYISAEEWRAVMDVNTTGPLVLTRELLPGMIERGYGDVVLVSSMAGLRPGIMPGVAYSAAKVAAKFYMDVLREEVRGFGIRCTTVYPGEVDTPILDNRPLPPGPGRARHHDAVRGHRRGDPAGLHAAPPRHHARRHHRRHPAPRLHRRQRRLPREAQPRSPGRGSGYAQAGSSDDQRLYVGSSSCTSRSRVARHDSSQATGSCNSDAGFARLRATKPGNPGRPVGWPIGW